MDTTIPPSLTASRARSRQHPGRAGEYIPALEGVRALAAIAVVITHVAFQTGQANGSIVGRVFGRFDLAVAVFFTLTGFLLWRPHASAAHGVATSVTKVDASEQGFGRYLRARFVRILPAYLLVVCSVLLFLPDVSPANGFGDRFGAGLTVWLANLTLTQVFVPLSLTSGLTQMWSLSVELAFYLLLPVFAWAASGLTGSKARLRIPVLLVILVSSCCWAFVPIGPGALGNPLNWLPGYLPWFLVGMIIAEMTGIQRGAIHRLVTSRSAMLSVGIVAFCLAASPWGGPAGLVDPEPWQFAIKVLSGAVLGGAVIAPLALSTGVSSNKILAHKFLVVLGRWSYGIFLWHLAVLAIVFPVFSIRPFSGHMFLVVLLTLLMAIPLGAASFALVEIPAQRALQSWEAKRSSLKRGTVEIATASTAINAGN
ncbi:MAG: acyltransferase family protein [Mycobacteriaceae bacterium]